MSFTDWWSKSKKSICLGILFGLSIAIVTYLLPREGKFRYEYQKGRPWMHDVLIAPMDFPVYKTEAELNRERDSALVSFIPYFDYDTSLINYQLDNFNSYFNEMRLGNAGTEDELSPSDYEMIRMELASTINEVYETGIYERNEFTENLHSKDESIMLVKGNVAEKVRLNDLFTHKEAYEFVRNKRLEIQNEISDNVNMNIFGFLSALSLGDFIQPNISYNEARSNAERNNILKDISLTRGMIQEGELIISKGELVNNYRFRVLESFRQEYGERIGVYNSWLFIFGQILIVSACFLILFLFLYNFRREVLDSFLKTLFILILLLVFVALARIVIVLQGISVYLVPFALIPIIIRTFYDPRLALFILMVTLMITGFIVPNSFEFIFLNFLGSVVVIFTLTNTYRRGKLFFSASMVFLTFSLVYFGIGIIQEGDVSEIDWSNYAWFAGNSVLLLLSYPLIYIFEKTFGFLSEATIFELCDTNQPLLRQLAEEAPGSFQHSMQVANLAEEAARAVGANPLLVRAGALYHDIGKVSGSEYFTENQPEQFNPHDKLEPEKSAEIIIGHIKKGLDLAKKFNLPQQIIDFIRTHQGTTKAYYFYRQYKSMYPARDIDLSEFTYPGPKPFTKEQAILMMADAVEASSRSLKEYSEEKIRSLVDSIIDNQMEEGQFTLAPITFRDISQIKASFVSRLNTIYHARIAYPEKEKE
ncbi:MAG TPA: HDIG domain-containing protein [Bacteroidetes bacterium]|nr:HDIG domain-containing protein [Bacteroidota bacterium]